MHNYKIGNIYSYENNMTLGEQIDECAEHMYIKHGVYPDLALINPKNMGEEESNYKTKTGHKIKLVPDIRQRHSSFVLAKTGS